MIKLPKIRENLLIQDLKGEVLIYDKSTNKSYCLNETAKTIFNACDGKKTFADLKLPEDIIYLSLDELKRCNLIESNYVSPFVGISRRDVIKKVGLATMIALPVITGLIAPSAINAASQGAACGASCSSGTQCRSGTCAFGGTCASSGGQYIPRGGYYCSFDSSCGNPDAGSVCCNGSATNSSSVNCGGAQFTACRCN